MKTINYLKKAQIKRIIQNKKILDQITPNLKIQNH
jgi:hypothetical protein